MKNTDTSKKAKRLRGRIDKMQKGGQIKNAVELCQAALKTDPTNHDLHARLGDLYIEWHFDVHQAKHYLDEAITEYQRALEAGFDSAMIHYKIGVALFHKGELDKALSHLSICIEQDSNIADAYYMIAKIYAKKDRLTDAKPYLDKAIKLGGLKASRAHYLMHLLINYRSDKTFALRIMSIFHLIISLFTLMLDKGSRTEFFTRINFLKFVPVFLKGYYFEKIHNYYRAIEIYSHAIENAPKFLPFYILLGDVYKSLGKISDAINEYRMAIWLEPSSITAYRSLCALYEEHGYYYNAIAMYQKLIDLSPNDAVYYSNLANIYYLKGKFDLAISCYQTAITLNPNRNWTSVIAQTVGFIFHESKENYDAAISAYQSASMLNPNDVDIYISLGSAFYDKGDYSNALIVYRNALEIAPDNARIHCNLGYLLWGKGLLDDSIKEYEIAIKLDPTYDIAYNNLGVIYLDDLGQINKAIELFRKAIEINANYALAHYNMARAMTIQGNKIEAARLYQVALDINTFTNELDNNEIKSRIESLFS